jgi:peptidoglycan/xylan/chitin deacetylase (PgdA/CDA1 family)
VTHSRGADARKTWRRQPFAALALAVVLGLAVPSAAPAAAASDPRQWSKARPDMLVGVRTTQKVVALSFDDGPDPRWTPQVLKLLAAHRAKATFFMEGQFAERWPALARQVVARGHELGNHTYDHPDLTRIDSAAVIEQVTRANAAFFAADLPRPSLFRPPKGLYDARAAAAVRSLGLQTAGWSGGMCVERWTNHYKARDAMRLMLMRVRPGAILLAHDGGVPSRERTLRALPLLLAGLNAKGYRVVTVSELLTIASRQTRK